MKIAYKEVKAKQIDDLKTKTSRYMIYRKFSTPFSYIFAKLNVSPSAISILNFFTPLIGFYFLSLGTYASIVTGILFFVLFKTLDCSDGEVARLQNPKAMDSLHKNIEGPYFDALGHYIYPIFLGMGLGMGLSSLYNNSIYLILGVFLSVLFTLEFALLELTRSYFRKAIIERKINKNLSDKKIQAELISNVTKGHSWSNQNIFLRMFGIYPFQGLIYSGEFILPILIVLVLTEYFLSAYSNFLMPSAPYSFVGIIAAYVFLVAIVKIVWASGFIYKMKKQAFITKTIVDMQNKKI